jgi:hypothetical protein
MKESEITEKQLLCSSQRKHKHLHCTRRTIIEYRRAVGLSLASICNKNKALTEKFKQELQEFSLLQVRNNSHQLLVYNNSVTQ